MDISCSGLLVCKLKVMILMSKLGDQGEALRSGMYSKPVDYTLVSVYLL